MKKEAFLLLLASVLALSGCAGLTVARPTGMEKIDHVVVICLENRSFDNLFGTFPGANGLANAGQAAIQVDAVGKRLATLPPVKFEGKSDPRFPRNLPNKPFLIDHYAPPEQRTGDLVHKFIKNREQINGGLNNRFADLSDAGALTMGYYDGRKMGLWKFAQEYTLADNFFMAAFGGSFLNHIWLACACTPKFDNAPKELIEGETVLPDGYAEPQPKKTLLSITRQSRSATTKSGCSWMWARTFE